MPESCKISSKKLLTSTRRVQRCYSECMSCVILCCCVCGQCSRTCCVSAWPCPQLGQESSWESPSLCIYEGTRVEWPHRSRPRCTCCQRSSVSSVSQAAGGWTPRKESSALGVNSVWMKVTCQGCWWCVREICYWSGCPSRFSAEPATIYTVDGRSCKELQKRRTMGVAGCRWSLFWEQSGGGTEVCTVEGRDGKDWKWTIIRRRKRGQGDVSPAEPLWCSLWGRGVGVNSILRANCDHPPISDATNVILECSH